MFFRKNFLPWTAAGLFETDAQFLDWLKKRHKTFTDLRIPFLVLAGACLIGGYVTDRRPIMLLTIVPFIPILLLSMALDRIEKILDGQNKTDSEGDEQT